VVERSDTTGTLFPPTLHPEGVPATFLIHPARFYFGLLNKLETGPVISLDSKFSKGLQYLHRRQDKRGNCFGT
jgi:hypothetical protein